MRKALLITIALILAFVAGWVLSFYCKEPRTVTIKEYDIKYNTITRDINSMDCKDAKEDLLCFYTDVPALNVKYMQDDEFELSASLCERRWNRKVKIEIQSAYRNMIIGGLFIDSQLRAGVNVQYYRFFGRLGIGGGVSFTSGLGQIQGGVAWLW